MTRANLNCGFAADSPVVVLPNAMAFLWSRTGLLREFLDIVEVVGAWPDARIIENRDGLTFAVNDVKLGHLKWRGQLVLAFRRESRSVIADEKLEEPDQRDEDVIVFNIRSATDVDRALCLLRFAYLISDRDWNECRPSGAVDPKGPPMSSSK
jgi:hypothetical protein